jgi:hypothetical protein
VSQAGHRPFVQACRQCLKPRQVRVAPLQPQNPTTVWQHSGPASVLFRKGRVECGKQHEKQSYWQLRTVGQQRSTIQQGLTGTTVWPQSPFLLQPQACKAQHSTTQHSSTVHAFSTNFNGCARPASATSPDALRQHNTVHAFSTRGAHSRLCAASLLRTQALPLTAQIPVQGHPNQLDLQEATKGMQQPCPILSANDGQTVGGHMHPFEHSQPTEGHTQHQHTPASRPCLTHPIHVAGACCSQPAIPTPHSSCCTGWRPGREHPHPYTPNRLPSLVPSAAK